jgi:predicted anti-sigma-YlaC factor YlaD
MNCLEFWNTMPELGGTDCSHLLECAACTARFNRQRQLTVALHAVAAGERRTEAPHRVEALALAAFREHSGLPARRISRHWRPAWAGAVAAMLLLGVTLIRDHRPQPSRTLVAQTGVQTGDSSTSEIQSDFDGFIPLPNSAGISTAETEDDVNLVRIAVPRSAMIALGVDVSEDRAGELVEADVVLGGDGVARAVKFLD